MEKQVLKLNSRPSRPKEYSPLPAAVTDILGDISPEEFDRLVTAMMPVIAEKLSHYIDVRSDPYGNVKLRAN